MGGRRRHDRGAVLPLVLVFVVALGLVVAATTRFAGTNLRYATVVQDRTAANAAAEAELRHAIERIRTNSVTTCDNGPVRVAPTHSATFNGAAVTVTCDRLDGGQATLAGWAAVLTGHGIGSDHMLIVDDYSGHHLMTGRMYLRSTRTADLEINGGAVEFAGDLFYDGSSDDCATIDSFQPGTLHDSEIDLVGGAFVCWPQTWDQIVDEPPLATLPSEPPTNVDPPWTDAGGCRVFDPGWYHDVDLDVGGHNYFRSGVYVFENDVIDTAGSSSTPETHILGGYPHDERFENRLITSSPCLAAQAADGLNGGPHGVVWYFGGNTRLIPREHTTIELLPMVIDDGVREHAVSLHVLGPGSPKPETLADGVQVIDDRDSSSYPHNHTLFQGQIWSPTQPIDLEDSQGDPIDGQITSGVVAAQLLLESADGNTGPLGPDLTPTDHTLVLSSVATVGDVTVEARAIVEYRPSADVDDRLAVRTFRFVR